MAITVVQTASSASSNPPITFTGNVTAGNTVFLIVGAYTSTSSTISSSGPKLGGSTVPGSVAFFNPGSGNGIMSPLNGTNGVYLTVWMLPNCPGGHNNVDITISGQSGITGIIAYEVNGLGNIPVLDKSSNGSSGTTTAVDSGSSGGITVGSEFVLGCAQIYAGSGAGPGGWTNTHPLNNTWAGWQVSTTPGTSYDWAQTGSAGNPWSAGVVTVAANLTTPAPFYPATQARAKLPVPLLTGRRVAGGAGAPVANPGVVPVYGAIGGAVRASLPVNLRGRVRTTPPFAAPQTPPAHGPAFTPLPYPARAPIPQNGPRGRIVSSPGAPVRNPVPSSGPQFYPFRQAVHIRFTLPPRGRVASGAGAPVRNPAAGPQFTQAVQPCRARIPQNAPRGRITASPGAPVVNIHRILVTAGDPFTTWATGSLLTFQP